MPDEPQSQPSIGNQSLPPGAPLLDPDAGLQPVPSRVISSWDLYFHDAVGEPISDLNLWLHLDGSELACKTNADGLVTGLPHSTEPVKLEVEKTDGSRKPIGQLQPIPGTEMVRVGSPKVRLETHSRVHELPKAGSGSPQKGLSLKDVWNYVKAHPKVLLSGDPYIVVALAATDKIAGAKPAKNSPPVPVLGQGNTKTIRNENNHPTVVVGLEEYTNNLKLGVNEEYRAAILAAAKRVNMPPQVLASVVNAECARDKTGKWVKDCKSKVSTATGMGQFLDGTWLGLATTQGNYLFDKAKELGYIEEKKIDKKNKKGVVVSSKSVWSVKVFSKGKLLDLRKDPETMLTMIGQYGLANLTSLKQAQHKYNQKEKKRELVDPALNIDGAGLSQVEIARLMYLCHFLGAGDARKFIRNTMSEERAKKIFNAQGLPEKEIKKYLKMNDNKYTKAFRDWWNSYNRQRIDPNVMFVVATKPEFDGRKLSEIVPLIGGTW